MSIPSGLLSHHDQSHTSYERLVFYIATTHQQPNQQQNTEYSYSSVQPGAMNSHFSFYHSIPPLDAHFNVLKNEWVKTPFDMKSPDHFSLIVYESSEDSLVVRAGASLLLTFRFSGGSMFSTETSTI